jgi:glutamate synthase domain-containing protein 3
MSGGVAYVLDEDGDFAETLQHGDGRARAGRRKRMALQAARTPIAAAI